MFPVSISRDDLARTQEFGQCVKNHRKIAYYYNNYGRMWALGIFIITSSNY